MVWMAPGPRHATICGCSINSRAKRADLLRAIERIHGDKGEIKVARRSSRLLVGPPARLKKTAEGQPAMKLYWTSGRLLGMVSALQPVLELHNAAAKMLQSVR
jgi:hypothetical protein